VKLARTFWPAVALLGATFALFEFTSLDLWVQDRCYDFAARRWLVDGQAPLPRALFYEGPKAALIVLGVLLLALALAPARWRAALRLPASADRRALLVVVATLATGPALIGIGKSVTNVFCPSEVVRYGGDVPYVRLIECYPPGQQPARRGHCFPAGHASGGFALASLAGLARSRRGQLGGLAAGVALGGAMGLYQMLKGAHYLSHTLVTALVAWLVFLGWQRVLTRHQP